MNRSLFYNVDVLCGGAGVLLLSLGGFLHNFVAFGGGLVAIGFVVYRKWRLLRPIEQDSRSTRGRQPKSLPETKAPRAPRHVPAPMTNVHDTSDLVEAMIRDGRFALLLRPQIVGNLDKKQLQRAIEQLEKSMVLVPSGPVCVGLPSTELLEDGEADFGGFGPEIAGRLVMVDPVFLDRYTVTNAEYQRFVDAGGYEQMALWDEEALPALLDFVDLSGQPGPRYWTNGAYPKGEAKLPVVGVSWYEANASPIGAASACQPTRSGFEPEPGPWSRRPAN